MKTLFLTIILAPSIILAKQEGALPGLAIGIVRAGEVPTLLTYGVKSLSSQEPIDAQTLFPIASCTKAFTCHLVCKLVDEGRLNWEDLAATHLSKPLSHPEICLHHMATHTTGTPRSDHLWQRRDATQGGLMTALGDLRQVREPGQAFEYSNLMYLALGKVVERITGRSWEEEVRQQILDPLGMASTMMRPTSLASHPNAAIGHQSVRGRLVEVPYWKTESIAPAGAICSNIEDMVRWVDFQLTQDPPLLSEQSLQAMRTPYIATPDKHYGLGCFLTHYRGHAEVQHAGGIPGFSAHIGLLPCKGIGVVLLTNCEDYSALVNLSHRLFDQLLSLAPEFAASI